jgi:hypothetical protein
MPLRFFAGAIAIVAGFDTLAATAPADFLGLQIGKPLTLPECESERIGGKILMYVRDYQIANKPCFKKGSWPDKVIDPRFERFDLVLEELPPGVHHDRDKVEIVDGNVEGFVLGTVGDYQAETLEALTVKFGQPTSSKVEKVKNRMGAEFDSIVAKWEFDNLTVTFDGLAFSVTEGLIVVQTVKGAAAADARSAEEKAKAAKF